MPTYLRSFTFWSWDVANPRTTVPFSNNLFSFFLVCTVYYGFSQSEFPLSIEEERAASEWFDSSSKDVERFTSHSFSLLVIQLLLSGFTGLCFARKMHSTSEFAKIVLSMCVCVCGANPCSQGIYELLSFSVLRQGVRAAHPVLHQGRHWMSAGDI